MSYQFNENSSLQFGHIYYDKWIIGMQYQRKLNNVIIEMGVVVSKKLIGREYDLDMEITFNLDGEIYSHVVEFDASYRLY
jgi:hypothetical protein